MIDELTIQMIACIATIYAVVTIGIRELVEILVGLYESLGIFRYMTEMHVVVSKAVADEQSSLKVLCTRDRRLIITFLILLRSAHIAFGIYGVVVTP